MKQSAEERKALFLRSFNNHFPKGREPKRKAAGESVQKPPAKRPKSEGGTPKRDEKKCRELIGERNSEVFEPKNIEDLVVYPKKIVQVKEWIQENMTTRKSRKILLLTGPCGSGKTATLKVLCAELKVDYVEFDPPQEGNYTDLPDYFQCENYVEVKGTEKFIKFVQSCDYISTEPGAPKNRLLCIENLPLLFFIFRDPAKLRECLLTCATSTRCMIVFVMSSMEKCWEYSPARLFPTSLIYELEISEIKFIAVCTKEMTKAVRRMTAAMDVKLNSKMVKQIVEEADGDVRSAVNNIQFSIGKDSYRSGLSSTINHLTFFHYIGKIMYAKRAEDATQQWRINESKLQSKQWIRRKPPNDDLNFLADNCVCSGNKLADWVFEHEPKFAPSISAASRILNDICDLDACQGVLDFENRPRIKKYWNEVVVRTTIYNNCPSEKEKTKNNQFYQLTKPQLTAVEKTSLETRRNLLKLLPGLRSADMFLNTIPLISKTKFFLRPEEKKIINSISLSDKLAASNFGGVSVKLNPRPNLNTGKSLNRTQPYFPASENVEVEEEFDISEDDNDS